VPDVLRDELCPEERCSGADDEVGRIDVPMAALPLTAQFPRETSDGVVDGMPRHGTEEVLRAALFVRTHPDQKLCSHDLATLQRASMAELLQESSS